MTPDVARTLVSAASALMPTPPLRMDTRVCSADTLAGVLASVGHASACQGEHSSPLGFGLSCGRQSCLQAAFQAAFSIRDEFLGLRRFKTGGHEAGEIPACKSSCARLDKLKDVLQSGAEMSLGAADATSEATPSSGKWPDQCGASWQLAADWQSAQAGPHR